MSPKDIGMDSTVSVMMTIYLFLKMKLVFWIMNTSSLVITGDVAIVTIYNHYAA